MALIAQPEKPRPGLRRCALLFALVAGLLAMHAMGTVGAEAPEAMTAHVRNAALAGADAPAQHGCDDSGHDCDGHPQHADPTCASAALGSGPVLPAPTAASLRASDRRGTLPTSTPDAADGGRAPPSLAELQLLRI